ncbi:hypothetical protein [Agrobacterium tumefaciens]|uniref:hypothetical protein n=2 Tax=Rhizobium/Agrobacterium group TaxID=227290 RepID=UPI0003F1ECB3|nr:hypothetical protein [Agrobacterium tumefaciens]AHK02724.1 hypothetical protein X971_2863 [Agrobacterium tumefaciens LBA4213 (Ach5)]NIB58276.1 hypothetical protein [Agrobacterium tumefaciens]NSZ23003.1 hypothetical protein [Agrobacterium tumefaciens]NTB19088.1 hypothetical protein [Agrobacterium tumefaciens]QQE36921.1 hypothetical protein I6I05_27475 [Agrobacterium tumefaciens]
MTFSPMNVLISGAGLSFNAGLPLASNFTPGLLNLSKVKLSGPSAALVAFVRNFVDRTFGEGRATDPKEWPELEDIFTLVDLSANTGHHLGDHSASDLRLVRRALIVRMIRMLSQAYSRGEKRPDAQWKLLETVFSDFDVNRTAVLNLNWDVVVETGFRRAQGIERVDYGCNAEHLVVKDSKTLRYKHLNSSLPQLHLIKPHGSVNWLYCDACREVFWVSADQVEYVAQTLFRSRDWDAVRERTGTKFSARHISPSCPHCETQALGTRFATFSYRKALDFPMHAASWRTAESYLKDSENWIFFGYSMPNADFEFKHMLKRIQLTETTRPKITLITGGSASAETITRFKRFFGLEDGHWTHFSEGLTAEVIVKLRELKVLSTPKPSPKKPSIAARKKPAR